MKIIKTIETECEIKELIAKAGCTNHTGTAFEGQYTQPDGQVRKYKFVKNIAVGIDGVYNVFAIGA
jgi:hypothetical protein